MANEKFVDSVTVSEKTEKEGTKGTYYACKTEKGLVYNVNEKVIEECGGSLKIGSTYTMEGVILPPREGYTHGSRWVNSFSAGAVSAPKTGPQTQKSTTPKDDALPGVTIGNIFNNATLLVCARVNSGQIASDQASIIADLNFFSEYFEKQVRRGTFLF